MPSWPAKLFVSSAPRPSEQPSVSPQRLQSIFPTLDETVPTLHGHQRSKSGHIPKLPSKNAPKGGEEVNVAPFGAVRRGTPEMTVGPCMTCASRVRWPANLKVFRCTVCLAINDLVPFGKPVETDAKGKGKQNAAAPQALPPSITADQTNAIVKNCLDSFLLSRKALYERKTPKATPASSTVSSGPKRTPQYHHIPTLAAPIPYIAFENMTPEYPDRPRTSEATPTTERRPSVGQPLDNVQRPDAKKADGDIFGQISAASQKQDEPVYSLRRVEQKALTEKMFRPLEEYIIRSFSNWDTVNDSFLKPGPEELSNWNKSSILPAKNAASVSRAMRRQRERLRLQSPWIAWREVAQFYEAILTAGDSLAAELYSSSETSVGDSGGDSDETKLHHLISREDAEDLESDIDEARDHLERVLLKAIEHLLKRPGKLLQSPEDTRALLTIIACPLLHSSRKSERFFSEARRLKKEVGTRNKPQLKSSSATGGPGQHSGIIKRILGLMSNLLPESHYFLVSWFSRLHEMDFRRLVDFAGSFITYRLTRQFGKQMSQGATERIRGVVYSEDWQIKAASKVLSLLAAANSPAMSKNRMRSTSVDSWFHPDSSLWAMEVIGDGNLARQQARARGHIIPTSDFYNSMLDYADLIADFELWESGSTKFSFCQYPILLSMGSKIQILEHDAKRQMELKAREAFFNSIGLRRTFSQYLLLRVRRDCLVEDSLKRISESVGGAGGDIKKGLRIEFQGEDGIDIGGLRKEWFLLLVRDIFDPSHGMFVYDEHSRYCYFNPDTFETTEQYHLVGVLLGLAIHNSTILDVALPPVVFKKLLSPNPTLTTPKFTTPSPTPNLPFKSTLEDLAFFRPALANGLRQLLEFDGDVESTFCRDFVIEVERYGQITQIPLIPGGEDKPVTNENRKEFVDLYAQYLLDTSVARQFEPFKRGFWTVLGGNALNLFQPDEIELLIRGSDEPLDITALRAVATYDNWPTSMPDETKIVRWFWESFESATPEMQRMLLSFITGSDRIPAMGIANMVLKISYGGPSSVHGKKNVVRYPIARTCFNSIVLWEYKTKEKLEEMLWTAVRESEGFGLK